MLLRLSRFLLALLSAVALVAGPAFAQEGDEQEVDSLPTSIKAGLAVGVRYILPTVTNARDRRHDSSGTFDAFIAGAYLNINQDLENRTNVWLGLGTLRTTGPEVEDLDDPTSRQLVLTLQTAGLRSAPANWFNLEAGVVRSPWEAISREGWELNYLSSVAARRYRFISEADLGASVYGSVPVPATGLFYHLNVTNGETDLRAEKEKYKAFQSRLTFRPLPLGDYLRPLQLSLGYGYKVDADPPGPERRDEQFFGTMLLYDAGLFAAGLENDLLLRTFRTDESRTPSGLSSLFFLWTPHPAYSLFARGDVRDYDLRNDPGKKAIVSSQYKNHTLHADEDLRATVMSGVVLELHWPLDLAPYVEATFYQEPAPGGGATPPTITANLVAAMRF